MQMKKILLGFCLFAVMAVGVFTMPHFFSTAYADDPAATVSDQATPPVFVATDFDTVCIVDLSAKQEVDWRHDETMVMDVITQSQRNLRNDSLVVLGMNDRLPMNMRRQ